MEFTHYKLKDLVKIKNGKEYAQLNSGRIPVYGSGGIMVYVDDYLYDGESILLPRKGSLDNIQYVNGKFWTIDTTYWTIVNSNIAYCRYLYLYLTLLNTTKRNTGSTLPSMTFDTYYTLDVYLPNYETQVKTADAIFDIINKIENNSTINSELESLAKTIYDYWFLQFDFPNEEGKPYKSSGGAMEYNEELKMNIPKGWEVHKLGDLTTLDLGGTPKTEVDSYWNGDINWLNSGEVAQFPVVCTEAKITNEGMNNSATKMMKKGTVVVSITGNIRTSILGIDSCGNQSIVGIRETSQLKKSYIYPNISHLLDHYAHLSTGNCQQHINKETLLQTNIIVPPDYLLDKYYEIVEPMYEQIINNGNESFELTSLRDYLLPLLMNGQVGFKDE